MWHYNKKRYELREACSIPLRGVEYDVIDPDTGKVVGRAYTDGPGTVTVHILGYENIGGLTLHNPLLDRVYERAPVIEPSPALRALGVRPKVELPP